MSNDAPRRSVTVVAKRFLVLVILAALGGAILWLLSERNARTYAVEARDGELAILRGRELPTGFVRYEPGDKLLARAYGPLTLGGELPAELLGARFEDRDQLDQALFRTLRGWVEARLDAEEPERLAQALKYLRRAELLTGISSEQRDHLKSLQGKVAYVEGKAKLEEADVALRDAVAKLRTASESRGRYAREAADLYERVSGASEQLSRGLRQAAALEPRREPLPAEKVPTGPVAAPLPDGGTDPDAAAPADAGVPPVPADAG